MAEFNYEQDIAPLKGNYFSDVAAVRGLTTQERLGLAQSQYAAMEPLNDKADKRRSSYLRNLNQHTAYERQKMALEEARREARTQREIEEQMPEFLSDVDNIMNNDELDPYDRTNEILKMQGRMSMSFPKSAAMQSLLGSAAKRATLELRRDQEKQLKLRRDIEPWVKIGAVDQVKSKLGDLAETDEGQAFISDAQAMKDYTAGLAESKAATASEKSRLERLHKLTDEQRTVEQNKLDKAISSLDGLEVFDLQSINVRDEKKVEEAKNKLFSDKGRRELVNQAVSLTGKPPSTFKGDSDQQLLDGVRGLLLKKDKELRDSRGGQTPAKATKGFFT